MMRELVYLAIIVMLIVIIISFVLALMAHRRDQHIQDVAVDVWRKITGLPRP